MSEGMAMLWRRTEFPPRGGLVRLAHWAKRAYTAPSAYRKLTASRLPVSSCWTSATSPKRVTASTASRSSAAVTASCTQARALASVPQPGFAWLDHRRESDLLQRSSDISAVAHDNLARDRHLEAPRHLERPLLVDRGRQRLFGCERQAESLLEPRSMPTQQGDGSVVGGDEHSRAGAIQPLLEEGGVGVGPFLGRKHERSLTPA